MNWILSNFTFVNDFLGFGSGLSFGWNIAARSLTEGSRGIDVEYRWCSSSYSLTMSSWTELLLEIPWSFSALILLPPVSFSFAYVTFFCFNIDLLDGWGGGDEDCSSLLYFDFILSGNIGGASSWTLNRLSTLPTTRLSRGWCSEYLKSLSNLLIPSDTENVDVRSLDDPTPLSQCLESPRLSLSFSSECSSLTDSSV